MRLPIFTKRPWSITRIRSALRIVVRRWATTMAVRPARAMMAPWLPAELAAVGRAYAAGLCALAGPGVLSVSGSCGRTPRMPAGAGLGADPGAWTEPGLTLGTWDGTSAGAIERVHSRSQVCRFFAAGVVDEVLPALCACRLTLSDGGASGVAAVCRRPVKDPPR